MSRMRRALQRAGWACTTLAGLFCLTRVHVLTLRNENDGAVRVDSVTLGSDARHPGRLDPGEQKVLLFFKTDRGDLGYTITVDMEGRSVSTSDCGYVAWDPTIDHARISKSPEPAITCK